MPCQSGGTNTLRAFPFDFCVILILTVLRSYDGLKKYIYQIEKKQHLQRTAQPAYRDEEHEHDLEAAHASEHTSLVPFPSTTLGAGTGTSESDALFVPLLDRELKKVSAFYETQEAELLGELAELEEGVRTQEDGWAGRGRGERGYWHEGEDEDAEYYYDEDEEDEDEDEEADEESPLDPNVSRIGNNKNKNRRRRRASSSVSTAWGRGSLTMGVYPPLRKLDVVTVSLLFLPQPCRRLFHICRLPPLRNPNQNTGEAYLPPRPAETSMTTDNLNPLPTCLPLPSPAQIPISRAPAPAVLPSRLVALSNSSQTSCVAVSPLWTLLALTRMQAQMRIQVRGRAYGPPVRPMQRIHVYYSNARSRRYILRSWL